MSCYRLRMKTVCGFFILCLTCVGVCVERCNHAGGSLLCETRCCGTYWNRFCCNKTEGEWCTLRGGSGSSSRYCRTGCCGTYYNQHCCPETTSVPLFNVTQHSNVTSVPLFNITHHHRNRTSYHSNSTNIGEWCNENGGSRYCRTGCCGTYWNRTCCLATTLTPVVNVTYHQSNITSSHSNNTNKGEWCNENGGSRYCQTGCCGTYWKRYCCSVTDPSTRYPTWQTTTPRWRNVTDRSHNGVWCTHRWGRMYCYYGCCGAYNNTYCCSSTGSPHTVAPETSIQTGTIVTIVVSCLAAIIGTIAIITGIYCCLRTHQQARGQILIPTMTTRAIQPPHPQGTSAATYTPTSTSTGPPGQTSYSNQTYFTPVTRTVIPNQAYIQGQQTQPAMPMNQTYVQKQIP